MPSLMRVCAVTVLAVSTAQADTIFVDDDAPLGGDGLSWNTAYQFPQDALADAVGGTEIRIAHGVYTPDRDESGNVIPGDRAATFQLICSVSLVGGHAGFGAPDPDARDITLYETILSGDLLGDDGPRFAGNDENSFHVITASGTDGTTVLDGLTIRAGNADGDSQQVCQDRCGGGIFNVGGSPTLIECTFEANAALFSGGAMYTSGGSPALTECTFVGNFAGLRGGGMYSRDSSGPSIIACTFVGNTTDHTGGAMYNFSSDPTIVGCTFEGNTAVGSAGAVRNFVGDSVLIDCLFLENTGGAGGAVQGGLVFTGCVFIRNSATYTDSGGSGALRGGVIVMGCTFIENTTAWRGGAMQTGGTISECVFIDNSAPNDLGGALYIINPNATVTGCIFEGNHAVRGGAIANRNSPTVIANCAFAANSADGNGGAIDNVDDNPLVQNAPLLVNCTFGGNSAGASGGGIFSQSLPDDLPVLTNCILWDNSPDQIFSGFVPDVQYSDVQGGFPGTGNIDADPLFVDAANSNLRLSAGSPAIDAGHNWAIAGISDTDLDGNPRFAADQNDFDPGCGNPVVVDMGAYELQGDPFPIRLGDIDGDGAVGIVDFLALLADWGACTQTCCIADLNLNGDVGINDFLILLGNWG